MHEPFVAHGNEQVSGEVVVIFTLLDSVATDPPDVPSLNTTLDALRELVDNGNFTVRPPSLHNHSLLS